MTGLPSTMTAIEIAAPGGPEMLQATTRPIPALADQHILVKVAAAGVNRPDVMQRKGQYPPPAGASDIPGLEIAGEIVAGGGKASRFPLGTLVSALVPGGGYAEYAAVHETNALPVPAGLSMAEAAALPETLFTVWPNLFDRGRLQRGETVLIHGGSSGIGTTAIQLAKAFGAIVLVTCGSQEKCNACLAIGATHAINYQTEDFVAAAKAFTGGRGVDVVLDIVGGDYVARNFEAAATEGRIVQIATQKGSKVTVDVRQIMQKRLTHTGTTLRTRSVEFKAGIADALLKNVWPLIEFGLIRPVIDSTFPLRDAADAHRRIETAEHIGKIVLKL